MLGALAGLLSPLFMVSIALYEGVRATSGLEWPWDRDAFRNIAQAQTTADGGWLDDPFFLDESAFYNPLLAWITALVARACGQPVHACYTTLGPYLNLLPILTFHLLLRRWFGAGVATAGTFHLLFLNVSARSGGEPFWANPTYSPWTLAANLGQCFFCLSLLAYWRAAVTRSRLFFALAGASLGLTFLSHTAPAALLVVLFAVEAARVTARERSLRALTELGLVAGCAILTASPFLGSIVGRYSLLVLNREPFLWRWLGPLRESLPALRAQLSAWSLGAIVGAALLLATPGRRVARRHLLVLVFIASASFGLPFLADGLEWRLLRRLQVAPQHHYWSYLRLFESAFVGIAGAALARDLAVRAAGLGRVKAWMRRGFAMPALALAVLLGLVAVYPSYASRSAFAVGREARSRRLRDDRETERTRLVAWMRQNTTPRDVFAASDLTGLLTIAPAGRKVLVLEAAFCNQYVDLRPRQRARGQLLRLLQARDRPAYESLAQQWSVSYLLLWSRDSLDGAEAAATGLEAAYRSRDYAVFRIRRDGPP